MGSQRRRLCHVHVYGSADCPAVHRPGARRIETLSSASIAAPTMSLFYCFNIFSKLAVGALSGFEYVAFSPAKRAHPRAISDVPSSSLSPVIALDVHSRDQFGARIHRRQTDRSYRSGAANPALGLHFFRSQAPSLRSAFC